MKMTPPAKNYMPVFPTESSNPGEPANENMRVTAGVQAAAVPHAAIHNRKNTM